MKRFLAAFVAVAVLAVAAQADAGFYFLRRAPLIQRNVIINNGGGRAALVAPHCFVPQQQLIVPRFGQAIIIR